MLNPMNPESLREIEPLLIGEGRTSALRPVRSAFRSRFAVRDSTARLGEGDPLATDWVGLDDVWMPQSLQEVPNGDPDSFGERVRVFLSHLFDSNRETLQDAEKLCRSLNEGKGK
jgi:hypothetical protein